MSLLSEFWDDAVGGAEWLKDVILGEFHEDQTPSEIVAGLMVSFVPGAVIVLSARDMTAVIIRMIRHPERRGEVMQWMIIVACAMGLVPALIGAAAGAAAAGVGAIVGGLAGDELGAAIRATCLVLIENTGRLLERLVEFIRRFVHGNILGFLRELKLAEYAKPVVDETVKFIGHLAGITRRVIVKAQSVKWIGSVGHLIERLEALEKGFYQIQREAVHKLPMAIDELQSRLGRALSEHMAQAEHPVHPNTPAPHPPAPHPPEPRRVTASEHPPLGTPPGLEPPEPLPPRTPPEENLHPQGVEPEPSAKPKVLRGRYPVHTKPNEAYFWSGRSPLPDGTFAGGAENAQRIASSKRGNHIRNSNREEKHSDANVES